MSEVIGGGVGGFVGGLIGSQLFRQPFTIIEGYDFLGAGYIEVGSEPTQLIGIAGTKAVMIRSPSTNNNTGWLGDKTVRPENGFPIYAGDTIVLGIRNPQDVYLVTENVSQKYYVIYLGVKG
jgi:hypothetical protein